MGELCTHLTIERVRLETLALKCARQFSTLLEGGRWKSTHRGTSLAAYPTACTVLNGGAPFNGGRGYSIRSYVWTTP